MLTLNGGVLAALSHIASFRFLPCYATVARISSGATVMLASFLGKKPVSDRHNLDVFVSGTDIELAIRDVDINDFLGTYASNVLGCSEEVVLLDGDSVIPLTAKKARKVLTEQEFKSVQLSLDGATRTSQSPEDLRSAHARTRREGPKDCLYEIPKGSPREKRKAIGETRE